MTRYRTIERLETRLTRLVEGMLEKKADQVDFLIGLNRLDDILVDHRKGQPISDRVIRFLHDYRSWRHGGVLSKAQNKRLGGFLGELFEALRENGDPDSLKLSEEVKDWLRTMGDGAFRITLKRPAEKVPLADRFHGLLRREVDELGHLLAGQDHLLTALDDLLKSAEAKTDTIYQHLAASIIYFLQMEGYKVDPYLDRLRRIRAETPRPK